jgi:hypothetical protein
VELGLQVLDKDQLLGGGEDLEEVAHGVTAVAVVHHVLAELLAGRQRAAQTRVIATAGGWGHILVVYTSLPLSFFSSLLVATGDRWRETGFARSGSGGESAEEGWGVVEIPLPCVTVGPLAANHRALL